MPTIKFTDKTNLVSDIFKPVPSKFYIPEWLKSLKSYETETDSKQTAKRCLPMMDAVMFGYTVVLDQDIRVTIEDGAPYFEWRTGNPIDWHPASQAHTHAQVDLAPIAKFLSPWVIETPPGYSCLFTQPMNVDKPIVKIFDAVVDTDRLNVSVNFPFLFAQRGWTGILEAGMPIAQIVPFKREAWKAEYPEVDEQQNARNERLLHSFWKDGYRKMFRTNKSFS